MRVCNVIAWLFVFGFAAPSLADEPWYDSETEAGQPMTAHEAAASMQLPVGFRCQLVASEPLVRNPIAMDWDNRGRLWIAENGTYAERGLRFDTRLSDRLLILKENDANGAADETIVFIDGLKRLTSFAIAPRGVWILCPPQLLFIPNADQDDSPDGPATVMLDGFDTPPENHHTIANGLQFGPDGWLYGRCGASSPGMIRRPDQSIEEAIPIAGGIWRYHPQYKIFEVVNHGTTNSWGHDWNAAGELFFINTVNGHLWHAIPGAHFQRPHSASPNPLVYEAIDTHADHYHWDTSEPWTESRGGTGIHDVTGGGHAHVGATIYLGGLWPKEFHDRLMTLNLHGRRVNRDRLERHESGYVGRHDPDPFRSLDPWFRGIDLRYGPDGNVVLIDWSDTGECHEATGVHRSSGRVFRLIYEQAEPQSTIADWNPTLGLAGLPDARLIELLSHRNQWWVRRARQEIVARIEENLLDEALAANLISLSAEDEFSVDQLTTAWRCLEASLTDATSKQVQQLEIFNQAMSHEHEAIRALGLRLLLNHQPIDTVLGNVRSTVRLSTDLHARLIQLAREDQSPLVRLTIASSLQRLAIDQRIEVARELAVHQSDASDHNLPLMVWFGLIPMARNTPSDLAELAARSNWPTLTRSIARRCGELIASQPDVADQLLANSLECSLEHRIEILRGLSEGMAGLRQVTPPESWKSYRQALVDLDLQADDATQLALVDAIFGEGQSIEILIRLVRSHEYSLQQREAALRTLIDLEPEELKTVCLDVLRERYLNRTALVGLTRFDDPAVAQKIANDYRSFHLLDRPSVLEVLTTRPSFCIALIEAMERQRIPVEDVKTRHVRSMLGLIDSKARNRLEQVWGKLPSDQSDHAQRIAELAQIIEQLEPAVSVARGRSIFDLRCANCHRLFGSGAEVGPDLTGSDRRNLDYLLLHVVDPSALVPNEFRATLIQTTDGRTLSGLVLSENESTLTLLGTSTRDIIQKELVEERALSQKSFMPEGLLDELSNESIRDLVAYLRGEHQVEPDASVAAPSID